MARISVAIGRLELVMVKSVGRLDIQVLDDTTTPETAVDPTELVLTLSSRDGTEVRVDTYNALGSRIVRTGVGRFYYPLGDTSNGRKNDETDVSRDWLAYWRATVAGENVTEVVAARVTTPRFMWALIALKSYIDKAIKPIESDTVLGYTDGQLALFLELGLGQINAAQPYPVWDSVDAFPDIHMTTLVESAVVCGLTAQSIFAIDTDIPSFVDQGNSFPLDHHPRLEATLQRIATRLDAYVPSMKRMYVSSGHLHVQMGPHFRIAMLVNMAPNGALFRGLFPSKGG